MINCAVETVLRKIVTDDKRRKSLQISGRNKQR